MAQQDLINKVVNRVNDFNRRIRDLEEKIRNLDARVDTLDDSLLDKTKEINHQLNDMEEELGSVRDRLANIEVDIKEINREKRKWITEKEIDEIESYIDLMNPINSSFATKKEVKKLIKEHQSVSEEKVEEIIDRKLKNEDNKSIDGFQ